MKSPLLIQRVDISILKIKWYTIKVVFIKIF